MTSVPLSGPVVPRKVLAPKSCWSRVELEGEDVVGPAGEGARRLTHVALGVVAHAHREELEQLAAEVLVRVRLHVLAVVEIHQHGRVFENAHQQVAQPSRGAGPQHLVLPQHHPVVAHLGVAGGEVAVPEERELLLERPRRGEHAGRPTTRRAAASRWSWRAGRRRTCPRPVAAGAASLRAAPSRPAPRPARGRSAPLRRGWPGTDPCPDPTRPIRRTARGAVVHALVVHQPVHGALRASSPRAWRRRPACRRSRRARAGGRRARRSSPRRRWARGRRSSQRRVPRPSWPPPAPSRSRAGRAGKEPPHHRSVSWPARRAASVSAEPR